MCFVNIDLLDLVLFGYDMKLNCINCYPLSTECTLQNCITMKLMSFCEEVTSDLVQSFYFYNHNSC